MSKVDPKALKEARKAKRWSRSKLSEETTINISTIYRLEAGKTESVREHTLRELAQALGVDESDLCQDGTDSQNFLSVALKVYINSHARNALVLVAHRYGISEEQIVEVAPLLFYIAAEQSLKDRQRRITELRTAAKSLNDLQDGIRHFPHYSPIDEAMIVNEENSIRMRDIIGDKLFDESGGLLGHSDIDVEEVDCPFTAYLRNALAIASSQRENLDAVSWTPNCCPPGAPVYEICRDEAAALVGGDEIATGAILNGSIILNGEPEQSPQELAALIRSLLDSGQAESDRAQADIPDDTSDGLIEPSPTEDDDGVLASANGGTVH